MEFFNLSEFYVIPFILVISINTQIVILVGTYSFIHIVM